MAFDFGRRIDKGWIIGTDIWEENPAIVIPRAIFGVVDLWIRLRNHARSGETILPSANGLMRLPSSGIPPLPGPGGFGDQPAALMDAFGILDRAASGGEEGQGG